VQDSFILGKRSDRVFFSLPVRIVKISWLLFTLGSKVIFRNKDYCSEAVALENYGMSNPVAVRLLLGLPTNTQGCYQYRDDFSWAINLRMLLGMEPWHERSLHR